MKKQYSLIIFFLISFILLNSIFPINSDALSIPYIVSVSASSYSSSQGIPAYLNLSISTNNVSEYGRVSVELVDKNGNSLSTKLKSGTYAVKDNQSSVPIMIPASLTYGNYYLKIDLIVPGQYSTQTDSKSVAYTIYPSNVENPNSTDQPYPVINSLDCSSATLIEGVIDGNLTIHGSNFSTESDINIVQLKNNITNEIIDTKISVLTSDPSKIEFQIPKSLKSGLYNIIVSVNDRKTVSSSSFEIKEKQPIINSISVSDSSKLIYGLIDGIFNISGKNFSTNESDVICYIIDSKGAIISTLSQIDLTDTKISFPIPKGLIPGNYYIRISVSGKSILSKDYITILSQGIPEPVISSLKTENSILIENKITGNLIISGSNLSPSPQVMLADSNKNSYNLDITTSKNDSITAVLPKNLKKGIYFVDVLVLGKTKRSTDFITILEDTANSDHNTDTSNTKLFQIQLGSGSVVSNKNDNSTKYKLDLEKIKSLVLEKSNTINNVFVLNTDDPKTNEITLGNEILSELKTNNFGLNIKNIYGEIIIPSGFFVGNKSKSLNIKIEKLDAPKLSNTNKIFTVFGNQVDFKITDSDNKVYSNFSDNIKITLPVIKADTEKTNKKELSVYYYSDIKNTWIYAGGRYDEEKSQISVNVNHLTKFIIAKNSKTFKDIPVNHWSREYIEVLASRNIIDGTGKDEFRPEEPLTRAQFTTLLVKGLDLPIESNNQIFNDVKTKMWYTPYIEAAVKAGWISGTGNGLFKPNDKITREQMASIIIKAYLFSQKNTLKDLNLGNKIYFTDFNDVSSWAIEPIKASFKLNLIKGVNSNEFKPKNYSNRAQAAVIIYRLMDLLKII